MTVRITTTKDGGPQVDITLDTGTASIAGRENEKRLIDKLPDIAAAAFGTRKNPNVL